MPSLLDPHSTDPDLPVYSQSDSCDGRVEHTYHLAKSGRQYLTLTFRSRAAGAGDVPSMYEAETISGSLELHLQSKAQIREVIVAVRSVTVDSLTCIFLDAFDCRW